MYQPEAYGIALAFMITSMVCWGSWANTMKLTAGYAFQLFYWDYVIGILLGSVLWGFTLGDRKSTRLNSSHLVISYAVFCLKKKNNEVHPPFSEARHRDHGLTYPLTPHTTAAPGAFWRI